MSLLELAIGWLAPATCIGCGKEGMPLCQQCQVFEITPFGERCYLCNKLSFNSKTCSKCSPSSPSHVWITTDYEAVASKLIHKLKFDHLRAAARPMAGVMTDAAANLGAEQMLKTKNYIVMPLPTATSRVRERSFDHTALLAGYIAKKLGLAMSQNLRRLGQSRQVGAKRPVRQLQATGNYYVANPKAIAGKHILLVDDVVTTGATLRAATAELRKAGAKKVDALVFAKKL